MQHTADVDDVAAIVGKAVGVISQFAFPLVEPCVFARVMYMTAKHPAIRGETVVIEHDGVVTQNQVVFAVIDFGVAADRGEVVHHIR